jgi:hypothetical protein
MGMESTNLTGEYIKKLRAELEKKKILYYNKMISYEEMRAFADEVARAMNTFGSAKARAAKMPWRQVTATGLLR